MIRSKIRTQATKIPNWFGPNQDGIFHRSSHICTMGMMSSVSNISMCVCVARWMPSHGFALIQSVVSWLLRLPRVSLFQEKTLRSHSFIGRNRWVTLPGKHFGKFAWTGHTRLLSKKALSMLENSLLKIPGINIIQSCLIGS